MALPWCDTLPFGYNYRVFPELERALKLIDEIPTEKPHQPRVGQHGREGRRRERQAQRAPGGQQGGCGAGRPAPGGGARPSSPGKWADFELRDVLRRRAHAAAEDGVGLLPRAGHAAGADRGQESPADAPLQQAGLQGLEESGDAVPVGCGTLQVASEEQSRGTSSFRHCLVRSCGSLKITRPSQTFEKRILFEAKAGFYVRYVRDFFNLT